MSSPDFRVCQESPVRNGICQWQNDSKAVPDSERCRARSGLRSSRSEGGCMSATKSGDAALYRILGPGSRKEYGTGTIRMTVAKTAVMLMNAGADTKLWIQWRSNRELASHKMVAATRIEQQGISRITVRLSLHHREKVIRETPDLSEGHRFSQLQNPLGRPRGCLQIQPDLGKATPGDERIPF